MKKNFSSIAIVLSVGTFLGLGSHLASSSEMSEKKAQYHLVGEIPIKGHGGWDTLTIDSTSHRLFMSHADRVVVVDTNTNQIVKEILDTPGVHAITIAADLKKAFSSNGRENKVSVIDLETLTTKTKIAVGENPDLILDLPETQEVYAFNGRSQTVSIINAKLDRVILTVKLPGKPEFAVASSLSHRVYVNIEDKNSIVVLDSKNHEVVATWKLEGCEHPSGIALDAKSHRLFSACENEKMVMLNTETGKTLASISIGDGCDGAVFDAGSNLVFSSNGKSGTVTIAAEENDKLSVVQTLKTQVGARTMALDLQSHRIYLPTSDFHPGKIGERPRPVDGTQKVLVYEP
jgi:YVTN family beta-propeller protein